MPVYEELSEMHKKAITETARFLQEVHGNREWELHSDVKHDNGLVALGIPEGFLQEKFEGLGNERRERILKVVAINGNRVKGHENVILPLAKRLGL